MPDPCGELGRRVARVLRYPIVTVVSNKDRDAAGSSDMVT